MISYEEVWKGDGEGRDIPTRRELVYGIYHFHLDHGEPGDDGCAADAVMPCRRCGVIVISCSTV